MKRPVRKLKPFAGSSMSFPQLKNLTSAAPMSPLGTYKKGTRGNAVQRGPERSVAVPPLTQKKLKQRYP